MIDAPTIEAVAKLVSAIAWPSIVLICVFLFREPLRQFIGDVENLNFPGGSVKRKVREEVDKAAQEAESRDGRSEGASNSELARAATVENLVGPGNAAIIVRQARELAKEYEDVRGSMFGGRERTRRMEVVVSKMRTIGRAVFPARYDLTESDSPGERLVVIAALQMVRDYQLIDWLADRVVEERPFVSYHAMAAILAAIRDPEASDHKDALLKAVATIRSASGAASFQRDPSRVSLLKTIEAEARRLFGAPA